MKRVVTGIILDDNRERVLMFKHTKNFGRWICPGGKVEEGETLKAAFKREMREELGITALDFWNIRQDQGEQDICCEEIEGIKVYKNTSYVILRYRGHLRNREFKKHTDMQWVGLEKARALFIQGKLYGHTLSDIERVLG